MIQGSIDRKCGDRISAIPVLEASDLPKLMAGNRNGNNRLADVRYKNFKNQAQGTTRNRVFLQPR